MHPAVHHARVWAGFALRCPWGPLLGAVALPFAAVLAHAAQARGGWLAVILAPALAQFALAGLFVSLMVEPGGAAPHDGDRLPALPLGPRHRLAAEVGVLALAVLICAAPLALVPDAWWGAFEEVGRALTPRSLLDGLGVLLPGLAAGRRMRRFGTPAALGPLLLTGLGGLAAGIGAIVGGFGLLVGALVAGPIAAGVHALEDAVDRAATALDDALPSPETAMDGPLHASPLKLTALSLRTVGLPMLVGVAPLMALQSFQSGLGAVGWLFAALPAALLFAPLGLDGRVALRSGRSRGFDGRFLLAFATLPVDPRTLRRAALRQAFAGATIALVGIGLGLRVLAPVVEQAGAPTTSPWALGALAAAAVVGFVPLFVASQIGDRLSRRVATAYTVVLAIAAVGGVPLAGVAPEAALAAGAAAAAALLLAGLYVAWRLATRPFDPDEV